MNVKELFTKYEDEFLNYKADLTIPATAQDCIIFSTLAPFVERGDLVGHLGYEQIYLNVDPQLVVSQLNEEVVLKMIRCGLRYSEDQECFCMFL